MNIPGFDVFEPWTIDSSKATMSWSSAPVLQSFTAPVNVKDLLLWKGKKRGDNFESDQNVNYFQFLMMVRGYKLFSRRIHVSLAGVPGIVINQELD
jgi:hypothetical protein